MVLRYIRPHSHLCLILVLLMLATTGLQLAGPAILGSFVDGVAAGAAAAGLLALGLGYLAAMLAGSALRVAAEAVGGRLAWRTTNALREDLLAHCLDQDLGFYDTHSPGELVSRVDGDVEKLSGFASKLLILLAVNSLLLAGVGVMLWTVDWRLGAGFTVLVTATILLLRRLVGAAATASASAAKAESDVSGYVEERLRGLEDLGPNAARAHTLHGLLERTKAVYLTGDRVARLAVRWPTVASHFCAGVIVLGLAATIVLYANGSASLGDVYAVFAYMQLLRMPMFVIANQMSEVDDVLGALRRSAELLEHRPSIVSGDRELPHGPLSVSLSHVDATYDGRPVLHDVSLDVPAGCHLALVGATGGGKTTIARLIARIVDPVAGAVRVGGVDVRTADIASLRRAVTYVTQEVHVLAASVRDNVALYDPEVPDREIREVLNRVGLGGWLDAQPEGLDTVLGSGAGLSAGEEQLLAIARVLLRDPGVVVLDEASSRIPPGDRAAVTAALKTLLSGRTAVVIAHRLDTVADADEVAVVAGGRIVEHGPRVRLAATRESRFAELLSASRLGEAAA